MLVQASAERQGYWGVEVRDRLRLLLIVAKEGEDRGGMNGFVGVCAGWNCRGVSQRVATRCAVAGSGGAGGGGEGEGSGGRGFGKGRASRGSRLALIGLGNPGDQFVNTRHNVGFEVADAFAFRHGGKLSMTAKFFAETCEVRVGDAVIMVVKPMTFMNLSGTTVRKVVDFYKLPLDALIVVTDDVNIDLGTLRLRGKGSAGGHNGLKHIEKNLGTQVYPRLRFGVGDNSYGDRKDYVLGKFRRSERTTVDDTLWDCMEILDEWVREPDLGRVMNVLARNR